MKRFSILLFGMLLSSCGSDNGGNPTAPPVSEPPIRLILKYVNEARANGFTCGQEVMASVPALVWNDLLTLSSTAHATDMNEKNYFSHTSQDGTPFHKRIEKAGYLYRSCGENIARGQISEREVVDAWLKSPGHCLNVMHPKFTEMGASRVEDYWVQNFGLPKNASAD
jgi:uncharacterized protein YkwD